MRINYRPCRMNTIHTGYCYGHKNEKGKSLFKHTHECFEHVSAQAYQLHCFVLMRFPVGEIFKYITKILSHTKYSLQYIRQYILILRRTPLSYYYFYCAMKISSHVVGLKRMNEFVLGERHYDERQLTVHQAQQFFMGVLSL